MVLKAVKNSLKKNCQKKHFCQKKKTLCKKRIWTKNFPKFRYFPKAMLKTMFFMFRTLLIHQPFVSNAMSCTTQQLLLHYQISQCPVSSILYSRLLFVWDITITFTLCISRTNQSSSSHRCLYRHQ